MFPRLERTLCGMTQVYSSSGYGRVAEKSVATNRWKLRRIRSGPGTKKAGPPRRRTGLPVGRFDLANLQQQHAVAADHLQEEDAAVTDGLAQLRHIGDGAAVDFGDDVARPESALGGRTAGLHGDHLDAVGAGPGGGRELGALQTRVQVGTGTAHHGVAVVQDGRHGPLPAVAQQADLHFLAGTQQADGVAQFRAARDLLAIRLDDDVVHLDAGLLGGGAGVHRLHQRAAHFFQAERLGRLLVHRADLYAQQATPDLAEFQDLAHDGVGHVRGHGEADAHVAAGAGDDGRVDADELAAQVHQRAAGVARVDGGVGLDEVLVAVRIQAEAAQRTHDARGHRVLQAEGIADGDDEIADLEDVGVADGQFDQPVFLDLQQRDVRAWVRTDDLGFQRAVVEQGDLDLVGAVHHVVVGDDIAVVRVHDDARARALHPALPGLLVGQAEEAEEGVVVVEGRAHLHGGAHPDVHHRRGYLLDERCETRRLLAAEQLGQGGRRGAGQSGREHEGCQNGSSQHAMNSFLRNECRWVPPPVRSRAALARAGSPESIMNEPS